jgi:broad specificity phosphatase PhoE
VVARVDDFCHDLTRALQANPPGGCALVVSSNGVLRFMLRLVDGLFDSRNAAQAVRMKTGHVSEFLLDEQGWRLNFWDQNPNDLS